MAGHSKWSKVKHIKGVLDVKRGKIFSKLSKEITVAARMGGGDVSMNPRLRGTVLAARAQNVPNDNIDRAIKRGTGGIEGEHLLEIMLESGAEELTTEEDHYLITTAHDQLYAVAEAVKNSGVAAESQRLVFVPEITVQITDEHVATQVIRLFEALEESEDVQNMYSNFDAPEELLAKISA